MKTHAPHFVWTGVWMRESVLDLWRRTLNLRRPEGARDEGSMGPKRLNQTPSGSNFISHNVLDKWFQKVNSPTKPSADCFDQLWQTTRWRFCGGVDFLKPFYRYIVWDDISRTKSPEAKWNMWDEMTRAKNGPPVFSSPAPEVLAAGHMSHSSSWTLPPARPEYSIPNPETRTPKPETRVQRKETENSKLEARN